MQYSPKKSYQSNSDTKSKINIFINDIRLLEY